MEGDITELTVVICQAAGGGERDLSPGKAALTRGGEEQEGGGSGGEIGR